MTRKSAAQWPLLETRAGGLNFVTFLMLAHRTSGAMNGTGWKYDRFTKQPSQEAASVRRSGSNITAGACFEAHASSSLALWPAENHGTEARRAPDIRQGPYHLRLASAEADRIAAFRLRFLVFNLELNEGLECAYATSTASVTT